MTAADEVIVHRRAPVPFDAFYANHFDRTHAVVLALRGRRSWQRWAARICGSNEWR